MNYSPFFDGEDTRYLNGIPKWLYPLTCRCRKTKNDTGWTYDHIRGIWVCPLCRLPSGFAADNPESKIVSDCVSCGDFFIRWNFLESEIFCLNCGGDNVCEPGKRTPDPMKQEAE